VSTLLLLQAGGVAVVAFEFAVGIAVAFGGFCWVAGVGVAVVAFAAGAAVAFGGFYEVASVCPAGRS
jgi:hypothetical protein